ncbi:tetranectin-like protein [Ruditapes philippinarum]|uniref:tetranectin-like protein n=1 Tax=Ruditapes philippinarum TaxID=129788 RepID=UPI00295B0FDD|nr:tetranectin-like protein [Ruditapes philippinarum]
MAVPSAALKTQIQGFASQTGVQSNVAFGVMDTLEEGQFIEAPTGELFTDLDWQSGKPTGSTSNNCIRMQSVSTWKMEDVSCTSSNNFICDCGDEST